MKVVNLNKFNSVLFIFLILITGCSINVPKKSLLKNRLSIESLFFNKEQLGDGFSIINAKINNGYFVSILSRREKGAPQANINYFLVIDLRKNVLVGLVENPFFETERYPMFDYSSDSLRLVSLIEEKIYSIDIKTQKSKSRNISIGTSYGQFSYFNSFSFFSKDVYGLQKLDNTSGKTEEIRNIVTYPHYYSEFSTPFNDSSFLFGGRTVPSNDSIEYSSNKRWSFRIAKKKIFADENFKIYFQKEKFLVLEESEVTVLSAENGRVLFRHNFDSNAAIHSHQLVADNFLYIGTVNNSLDSLYSLNLTDFTLKFISDIPVRATHLIKMDSSYFLFSKNSVYEIQDETVNKGLERKDLINHYTALFLSDLVTNERYFFDSQTNTLYW